MRKRTKRLEKNKGKSKVSKNKHEGNRIQKKTRKTDIRENESKGTVK